MSKPRKNRKNGQAPVAEPAVNPEQDPKAGGKETVKPQGDSQLNAAEELKFKELEKHIELNLGGFMIVGKALKAISDEQLYRAKFKKFEDYCPERWGLSKEYAYRLIQAYTCVTNLQKVLSPKGEQIRLPVNESQVRPMTPLEPEKQVEAWQQVLKAREGKSITADEVDAVVNKMLGKSGKAKTTRTTAKSNQAKQKLVKIEKLVTKALKDDSELTVDTLKQVLEKIQKLLGIEK